MKNIDTSTFDFPGIIANDFLYVDKTSYVWNLVCPKKGEYFLSRPRRFGKSLLVSTLKTIFQGRRELFKLLRCLQAVGRERRGGIPHERRANRRVHPHTEKRLYF